MKKGILLLLSLGFMSCDLEEDTYSSLFTEEFYQTASDAEAGLTSAYGALQDLYNTAGTAASDFSSDQSYARPVVGRDVYALFNYDPNYTTQRSAGREFESPQAIWRSCYSGIERANWILHKVPTTQMTEVRREQILGEAYYLRAFYHWFLTKNFGDVVIKSKPSANQIDAYGVTSPKAEVYQHIFNDLEEAAKRLPSYGSTSSKGRPSKEVALALYAKAALYDEKWALALEKANAVISSGKYQLLENVVDLYDVKKEDFARQEIMWAFECESSIPQTFSNVHSLFGPRSSSGLYYLNTSFGSALMYQSFFDSFDENDARRSLMDTTYVHRNGNLIPQKNIDPATPEAVLLKKYMDANSVGGYGATNIPIFRLADLYLIAAEAEGRLNGPTALAYSYINVIRKRAKLDELTPNLSKEEFIKAILQERSWEFYGEGDRWYDLTRTNTFLEAIPKATNNIYPTRTPQARNRYFPIPLEEINANPDLKQNPEWL